MRRMVGACLGSAHVSTVSPVANISNVTESLKLYQYGDRELWVISGDEWTLPMYLDWLVEATSRKPYALITPACALYPSQHLAVNAVLGVHNLSKDKQRWIVSDQVARGQLSKAAGITPRFYYKWPDGEMMPITTVRDPIAIGGPPEGPGDPMCKETETFLSFVSKRRSIPVSMLRATLSAIGDEAAAWMLERRGVINLGFCKLAALPYRVNWKQIVAYQCKKWGLRSILKTKEHKATLDNLGFPGLMCSERLVGLTRRGKSDYRWMGFTIEAIPSDEFDTAVADFEGQNMPKGHRAQVDAFERTVEKLYDFILEALKKYTRKAYLPYARVRESSATGVIRFVPSSGLNDAAHSMGLVEIPVDIVEGHGRFSVFADPGRSETLRAKAPPVLPLPTVSPRAEDLRERQGSADVHGPRRGAGDSGVPLLDAGQGEAEGEPVLSGTAVDAGDPQGVEGGD